MDHPGIPQSPVYGSQASEGSYSIAPQAPCHRIDDSPSTASQLPQHDRLRGSQRLPSGIPRLLPELSSWQAHRSPPLSPQPSAPPSQASSSVQTSSYAPGGMQQDLASLESQDPQQYTASQIPSQYLLSSSYYDAINPSNHLISDQESCGENSASCFGGVEGSRSGHGGCILNGDGSPLTSMDASGQRISQGSFIEPYNPGAEQSNEQAAIIFSGVDLCRSCQVPFGANISDNCHRLDGMRNPFNRRSATDQYEDSQVSRSQIWDLVPIENNSARRNQGIYSQERGYPVDPSTFGIDPSLQFPDFSEMHGPFVEDANSTNTETFDSQNQGYAHDPSYLGNTGPSKSSASAPNYAYGTRNYTPETRDTRSSTASKLTPPLDHVAYSQLAPSSRWTCQDCDQHYTSKTNLRRHTREKHTKQPSYKCLLNKNALACASVINDRRNRRKHVDEVHPRESAELPPRSENHRPNSKTDWLLNRWFTQIPQSSAQ